MRKPFLFSSIFFSLALLVLSFSVHKISAFSGSEVNITNTGAATVGNTKVMQIAGSTFFTRMYWGDAYVRLTVRTDKNTKFFRGTGEPTTVSEISVGDLLDVSGRLEGGDVLNMTAATVKNSSVQKKQTVFSGKVQSVDLANGSFVLNDKKLGSITVVTNATTTFTKGNRTLDLGHISSGDTITKTSGDYDLNTKTLVAKSVLTYVDMTYYSPKNFQGTIQEIEGTTVPTTIKILINGKLFTVPITEKVLIMNKIRSSALISRFEVGDTVRLYGAIREVDEPIIDIEIIRNLDL